MPAVIDSNAVQAVFARPLTDGSFEPPIRDYLRAIYARRPFLLLAFPPKCAGTYFRQAAIHALGGQLIRMCHAQGGRDGTLYLPNVLASCLDDTAPVTVTHLHMQALTANRSHRNAEAQAHHHDRENGRHAGLAPGHVGGRSGCARRRPQLPDTGKFLRSGPRRQARLHDRCDRSLVCELLRHMEKFRGRGARRGLRSAL